MLLSLSQRYGLCFRGGTLAEDYSLHPKDALVNSGSRFRLF